MIVKHPTLTYNLAKWPWTIPVLVVECQECGNQSTSGGGDAGEAAEAARREGFVTFGAGVSQPKKWVCRNCYTNHGK